MPARQSLLPNPKRPLLSQTQCILEQIRITALNSPCRGRREESQSTVELQSVERRDRFWSDNAELATLSGASSSSTSIRDANVPVGLAPSCKPNGYAAGNRNVLEESRRNMAAPRLVCRESEQLHSRVCERLSGNTLKFTSQNAKGRWHGIFRGEGYLLFDRSQLVSSRSFSSLARGGSPKEVKSALATTSVSDSFGAIELPLDSVVKVFTVSSSPNYFLPWQNKPQREITGSGFVISGRRVLTNAHVVADQTFVKVRKHGSPEKFKAKVEAVGHECDLALLTVEENEFWEGMLPLEFGGIPHLQEAVAVVGYPQGGDNISVTGGVVSRVEPTQYVHGASHLMAVQIDAAINPGNSGGPALMDDKVVGVAFQNLANAENIGYIIPVPVISHFLEDVEERGKYVGFCTLGLTCQATENGHLREHLEMPDGLTGVLVSKVHPLTDTHRWVKKDDVILAFDGYSIANDGTVHFRNRERITFDHLVSMKKAGETGLLKVLRNGKELEFMIKLGPIRPLVPIHQFDQLPSYFIFAGLVFTPLIQPYLHEYGEEWYNTSPRKLCELALHAMPTKFGEQIVVLSQVLVDDINAGYERLAELQVKKVNGVDALNLRHLRQLVDDCKETSIRFDLEDGRVVVLNYEAAKEASFRILDRHRIPFAVSKDLLEKAIEEDAEEWEKTDNTCEEGVAESVSLEGTL